MLRAQLRRLWLTLHRWTGLTLGPLLALTALLGAVLVVALPLDRAGHPEFFTARSSSGDAPSAPLEPLRQRLLAEFGPDTTLTMRPPRQAQICGLTKCMVGIPAARSCISRPRLKPG